MNCTKCGFECPADAKFCPGCGIPLTAEPAPTEETPSCEESFAPPAEEAAFTPPAEEIPTVYEEPRTAYNYNPVPPAAPLANALKDKLFTALCILLTASCVLGFLAGSLNVINILITVFLWLTYVKVKNNASPTEYQSHLRMVSGTVYAGYIVANVIVGIIAVCALLVGAAFTLLSGLPGVIQGFTDALQNALGYTFSWEQMSTPLLAIIGLAIAVGLLVTAALIFIVNLLGTRKLHRFAKATYEGITDPTVVPEKTGAVRGWLIFFGVCEALGALSSEEAFLAGGCAAAASFIAAVLIKRYFPEN